MAGNIITNQGFFTATEASLVENQGLHTNSPGNVFPVQASAIKLSATASVWGDFTGITEIMSSGDAPSSQFDIHWVVLSEFSAIGCYELRLYSGAVASEVLIGKTSFASFNASVREGVYPFMTVLQSAGTRISAALSSSNAVADTLTMKFFYHEY